MRKALAIVRGMVSATARAIRRPGITTATERYLWISAWCLSGFAILFGFWAWTIVSVVLALGWSLGLYVAERSAPDDDGDGLRLVHDVDEEGLEPSRLRDTGS